MQPITREQEWKDIHKRALLNESFVEVSLEVADQDAMRQSTVKSNGEIYTSDPFYIAHSWDLIRYPYCTLEQNLWCLDGSRKAIAEEDYDVEDTYVSDVLSDETCVFSSKRPTITISFLNGVQNTLASGITINWSETYQEWADAFEIIVYDTDDKVIAKKEVMGNKSIRTVVLFEYANYKRIDVIVTKWCLPHRRARIESIVLGLQKVFGKGDLFSYSHKQYVDPISTSLPKSEITFSINNVDGEYNPNNPGGISKYLMERQEVKVRYGLKMDDDSVEWTDGGRFYLSEWYAKQNGMTADFTARDGFEFMTKVYKDDSFRLNEPRSLRSLAATVLNSVGLTLGYDVDVTELYNTKITAPLPEDTIANILQLIANAARCVLYQDREGQIRIEPLTTSVTDYEINSFNSYSKSEISLSKPLKQVKVKVYEYYNGTNGLDSRITEVSYPADGDIPSGSTGEIITVDNPLVTAEIEPEALAEWMYSYLKNRITLESSWRADVRLDAGDVVKNRNDYDVKTVCMTDVEYTYNGAFRGTGKGKVIGNG